MSDDTGNPESEEELHPKGTFFLMLLFLAMIATMWIWMYVILVTR